MTPTKLTVCALALMSLAACSGSKKEQPKLDYQSTNRKVVNLEVPPDLTNPNQGNLYQLPAGSGAACQRYQSHACCATSCQPSRVGRGKRGAY